MGKNIRGKNMRGFSLVELSIVLVILALLTGMLMVGRHVIRSTELQAIIREAEEYKAAINTFRERYLFLPGDMPTATNYFGVANADPDTCFAMNKKNTRATCNGNGDKRINIGEEVFLVWHHLASAELISGAYEGRHDPDITVPGGDIPIGHTPGKNSPQSKFRGGTGYGVRWMGVTTGLNNWFEGSYGHVFMFGEGVGTNNLPRGTALTPPEAFKLDNKYDDGLPASGNLVTRPGTASSTPNCTESVVGAADVTHGVNHPDAVYRLSLDNIECVLIFRNVFE